MIADDPALERAKPVSLVAASAGGDLGGAGSRSAKTRDEIRAENRAKFEREQAERRAALEAAKASRTAPPSPKGVAPPMPDPSTPDGREAFARSAFAWAWKVLHDELPGTNIDRTAILREARMAVGWGKEAPKAKDTALPLGSILRPDATPDESEVEKIDLGPLAPARACAPARDPSTPTPSDSLSDALMGGGDEQAKT